jgi:predicted Fe-S protein YdhL (DUF1289 family)
MSVPSSPPPVASPCIKICVLDAHNVCVGCGRSLSEIAAWSRLSPEQQREICRTAAERKLRTGTV